MPDLFSVLCRRWKLLLFLPLAATALALLGSLLSTRKYLGVATALPANSALSDKARLFSQNIELLYAEVGTPDDLDKLEGTAKLDTLYLAVAEKLHLAAHYRLDTTLPHATEIAALRLRKNSVIQRTGYGELKIRAWDVDNQTAAAIANALLQTINDIHQRLQSENNRLVLQRLQEALERQTPQQAEGQGAAPAAHVPPYGNLIKEYELALAAAPNPLLVVEHARPQPWPDKPDVPLILLAAFSGALFFAFLLAFYTESRNPHP